MSPEATASLRDFPAIRRTLYCALLAIIGLSFLGITYLYYRHCGCLDTTDQIMAGIGASCFVAALIWWLWPLPPAADLVAASDHGIELSKVACESPSGAGLVLRWSDVGELSVEQYRDAWHLRIPLRLSEQERISYRNAYGGYGRDPNGFVEFFVPALTRRRGQRAADAINSVRTAYLSQSSETAASNFSNAKAVPDDA